MSEQVKVDLTEVVSAAVGDGENQPEVGVDLAVKNSEKIGILIRDPRDFRDLDTKLYRLVAERAREVLAANASFKNVQLRIYPDAITVYGGAVSNVLVRVSRGRALDIGGGRFVWKHASMVSRQHIVKALQENKRTKMLFSWPTWAYASRTENGSGKKKKAARSQ